MLGLQFLVPLLALVAGLIYVVFGDKTYSDPYIRGIHHSAWVVLALVSLMVALKYAATMTLTKPCLLRSAVILSMPLIAAIGATMVIVAKDDARPEVHGTRIAGHVWIAVHGILVGIFIGLPPSSLVKLFKGRGKESSAAQL